MRVISGIRKGMNLYSPKGIDTRPTEDRIKESIFDTLFQVRSGSKVLDLFAGTGAIGIEFLSRGSEYCVFSELQRDNMQIIRKNLQKTRFTKNSRLLQGDYEKNLQNIKRMAIQFDYIYIDPPYQEREMYFRSLEWINRLDLLRGDGLIIMETKFAIDQEAIQNFNVVKIKKYGKKHHIYYLENSHE